MDTSTILYLCISAAILLFIFFNYKKESMTNVSDKDQLIIDAIFDYINDKEGTFADYINFLTSIKNTNLNIIDSQVFATFTALKKRKLLTKEDIVSEMKLV
jgi:hypothetical protein